MKIPEDERDPEDFDPDEDYPWDGERSLPEWIDEQDEPAIGGYAPI